MKTDLNSLKKELKRLADVDYLKKEINRLAAEIKNFDLSQALTPQAKARVAKLEKRFNDLKATLQELQAKADATFAKFSKLVRGTKKTTAKKRASKKAAGKKTAKKTSRKTVAR